MMRELPDVLTVREVAEVLRCSKAHICKILNGQVAGTPKLPAIGLGRRKLVRRTTLLQWLSDNELGANMTSSLEVDAGRRA
jgi:excisionase family DNA binding protein